MSALFDTGVTGSSITQQVFVGGSASEQSTIMSLYIATVTPVALAVVTVVMRWNDGLANRSHAEVVLLTTLNNYRAVTVPILQGVSEDISIESTVVGIGVQYRVAIYGATL